jgi:hypothetical protein
MIKEIDELVKMHDDGTKFTSCNDFPIIGGNHNGAKATNITAFDANDPVKARKIVNLLNYLPELFKDVDNISTVIVEQQNLIIQLENQIKCLSSIIETVALGKIQIEVSKELHKYIIDLANDSNMYSHEGGEITLEVNSSMFSEKSESTSKNIETENMNDSLKKFSGGVGGILKIIADLKISGSIQESIKNIENSSLSMSKNEKDTLTMSGKAVYKYGDIKCDPTLKIIEKMREDKDKRLTKDLIAELRKNPHKED